MKIKSEEELLKEKTENWKKLSEIIKYLETKGLEIKECIVYKNRVEYVKGTDLENKLKENLSEICDKINKELKLKIDSNNPDIAINEIYYQFKNVDLINKACREEGDKKKHIKKLIPYEELALLNKCNCGKNHDELEYIDHPKFLDLNKLYSFDPSFYYILTIYHNNSKLSLYLFLVITAIILFKLIPIWPDAIKLSIWWISYIFIILIIALFILRFLIYIFFYIFGYDIWIFPDLDNPKLGYFESFKRIISIEKRNDDWEDIITRIFMVICIGIIIFFIYRNPLKIKEIKNKTYSMIKNMYNYGQNKLFSNNSSLTKYNDKKYMSLEDIDNL